MPIYNADNDLKFFLSIKSVLNKTVLCLLIGQFHVCSRVNDYWLCFSCSFTLLVSNIFLLQRNQFYSNFRMHILILGIGLIWSRNLIWCIYLICKVHSSNYLKLSLNCIPSVFQTTVSCGASAGDSARCHEQIILSCLDDQVIRGLDAHCYQSGSKRS